MSSLQESFTLPQWVVDDTDDFINVLENNLGGETQSNLPYIEGGKIPGIELSPYNNKEKTEFDHSNSEIDRILLNLTQQDHQKHNNQDFQMHNIQDLQIFESPVHQKQENQDQEKQENQDHSKHERPLQQLSESERIDRMNEGEVIDYLVGLMKEDASDSKAKQDQANNKKINDNVSQGSNLEHNTMQHHGVIKVPDTNLLQTDVLGNGNLRHTLQHGDASLFSDTSVKIYNITSHSEFQNPNSNNIIMGDNILPFYHPSLSYQTSQSHQNNQNIKEKVIQSQGQNENLDKKGNNDYSQNKVENGHIKIVNQIRQDHSANQKVNHEEAMKVKPNHMQYKLDNKTIYIQNSTINNNNKCIINKNINHVRTTTTEKPIKVDAKKILELVNAQNKAFRNRKETTILKRSTINQNHNLQKQITIPLFNKEKDQSTKTPTKKRKKYEEDPQGDEEEGKKIFQAKKAKNYREKKKEEFKMKDIQIKKLQEALQKSEKEKNAYMNENKHLKEEIKKKDLLLQLYEVN